MKVLDQQFKKWLPNPIFHSRPSRATLLCFHSAGNDSSIFTAKAIRGKPHPNYLTRFCQDNRINLLCPVYPGRSYRYSESLTGFDLSTIAKDILDKIQNEIDFEQPANHPLYIVGHSMGCLVAFHFIQILVDSKSLPLPRHVFLSSCVDATEPCRPWIPVAQLNDDQLKKSMTQWDVDQALFNAWDTAKKVVRQDLHAIDITPPSKPIKYETDSTPQLTLILGKNDSTITPQIMHSE